jgi:hypothetical protein
MIEQTAAILGHFRDSVIGWCVEFLAAAVPAIVERDDAPAIFRQGLDPLRKKPVDRVTGRKAVNEQNGFAAVEADSRLIYESEAGSLSGKLKQWRSPVESRSRPAAPAGMGKLKIRLQHLIGSVKLLLKHEEGGDRLARSGRLRYLLFRFFANFLG